MTTVNTIQTIIASAKVGRNLSKAHKTTLAHIATVTDLADVALDDLLVLRGIFSGLVLPKLPQHEPVLGEINLLVNKAQAEPVTTESPVLDMLRDRDLVEPEDDCFPPTILDVRELVYEHIKDTGLAKGPVMKTLYDMSANREGEYYTELDNNDVRIITTIINRAGAATRDAFIQRVADTSMALLDYLYPQESARMKAANDPVEQARLAVVEAFEDQEILFAQKLARAAGNSQSFIRASMVLNEAIRTHHMSSEELANHTPVDVTFISTVRRICWSLIVNAPHTEYDKIMDNRSVLLFLARPNHMLDEVRDEISKIAKVDPKLLAQMQSMDNKIRESNVRTHYKIVFDALETADQHALFEDRNIRSLELGELHRLGCVFIRAARKVREKTIEHAVQRNTLQNIGDIPLADAFVERMRALLLELEDQMLMAGDCSITQTVNTLF